MPQLTTGKHAWEVKNLGDADLELWLESSTCSCTIAKLKSVDGEEKQKIVVQPQQSTSIDLEWETRTFHDEYNKGAVIGTNDPAHPTISLYDPRQGSRPGHYLPSGDDQFRLGVQ